MPSKWPPADAPESVPAARAQKCGNIYAPHKPPKTMNAPLEITITVKYGILALTRVEHIYPGQTEPDWNELIEELNVNLARARAAMAANPDNAKSLKKP